MKIIPYGRQDITDEDIEQVVTTLRSDFLTQGPKIAEFEQAFASYVGSKYAVALSNGTAALHLCALALDVKPGDKVITTPITFAASANCVRYCGGNVEFVDIDPESFLMDLERLEKVLESSPPGTYTGVIPVDFAGRSVDFQRVKQIADKFGLWIIEDACHAPGGFFIDSDNKHQLCGNGQFADLSIFSFHPVKHIAAGEGGMITTNNQELYRKLLVLRSHGITRDQKSFVNSPDLATGVPADEFPLWYMEMQELGYNYRLTDFQAALGLSQLKRADQGLIRRREIAKIYSDAFGNQPFLIRQSEVIDGHAYHLYVLEVSDRLGLYNFLREKNIYAQIHYFPVHLMPYYQKYGWKLGDFPIAEEYYRNCISLPMYPTLTNEEQQYVIQSVIEYYHG